MALQVERIVLSSRYVDMTLQHGASPEGQGTADASWPSRAHLFVGSTGGAVRNGSSIEVAGGRGEATRMTTISFARHQFLLAVIIAGAASDFKGQKIYQILCYSFFVFTCFRFEISKFYLKLRVYCDRWMYNASVLRGGVKMRLGAPL